MTRAVIWGVAIVQLIFLARFLDRVRRTVRGKRIAGAYADRPGNRVTLIVPVLNEERRLERCLESLIAQSDVVSELLIVDGGSTDRTADIICDFARRDTRVRLIDASPVSSGWNGKAWGLQVGLQNSSASSRWVVTIDADVSVEPGGIENVVGFADANKIPFLSIACQQRVDTPGLSLMHPSMLTTLVYRFGIPGQVATTLGEVQSNGQFAIYDRVALIGAGGFQIARDSICEDVTVARHLFLAGYDVGFYEADGLAETAMHGDGLECLRNWPRSLTLRDRFRPFAGWEGLLSLVFLQALPLVLAIWPSLPVRSHSVLKITNRLLLGVRVGVLIGIRRAYVNPRWTYWLSPLFVPITVIAYSVALLRRRHTWRGRTLLSRVD